MASLALSPCPRDHCAQYPLFTNVETEDIRLRQGLAQVPPLSHSRQRALAPVADLCLLPEADWVPTSLSGPYCLTSLGYQAKPGWLGFSHTRLASPRPLPQSRCPKGHSQAHV